MAFITDLMSIQARRYVLGNSATRRRMAGRATCRGAGGLFCLQMLCMVKLGAETDQPEKTFGRRI
jgi:hypothetical protein